MDWISDTKTMSEKVKASTGAVGLVPPLKVVATAVGAFADLYAKFCPNSEPIGVTRKFELFQKAFYIGWISPALDQLPDSSQPEILHDYEWQDWRRQLYTVYVFADDNYLADGYAGQTVGYQYDLYSYDERQKFQKVGSGGGAGNP